MHPSARAAEPGFRLCGAIWTACWGQIGGTESAGAQGMGDRATMDALAAGACTTMYDSDPRLLAPAHLGDDTRQFRPGIQDLCSPHTQLAPCRILHGVARRREDHDSGAAGEAGVGSGHPGGAGQPGGAGLSAGERDAGMCWAKGCCGVWRCWLRQLEAGAGHWECQGAGLRACGKAGCASGGV